MDHLAHTDPLPSSCARCDRCSWTVSRWSSTPLSAEPPPGTTFLFPPACLVEHEISSGLSWLSYWHGPHGHSDTFHLVNNEDTPFSFCFDRKLLAQAGGSAKKPVLQLSPVAGAVSIPICYIGGICAYHPWQMRSVGLVGAAGRRVGLIIGSVIHLWNSPNLTCMISSSLGTCCGVSGMIPPRGRVPMEVILCPDEEKVGDDPALNSTQLSVWFVCLCWVACLVAYPRRRMGPAPPAHVYLTETRRFTEHAGPVCGAGLQLQHRVRRA